MRLWTVHPKYLDARGLVALWREALLAQAVLRGRITGLKDLRATLNSSVSGDPGHR